jgi:hypothetical protein
VALPYDGYSYLGNT